MTSAINGGYVATNLTANVRWFSLKLKLLTNNRVQSKPTDSKFLANLDATSALAGKGLFICFLFDYFSKSEIVELQIAK